MIDTPAPGPQGPDLSGGTNTALASSASLRLRIIDWVQFIRTLAVNLIVIISIAAIVVLLTRELLREPVIIEEVSLPPSLTAQGYSGAVTAQRLWDAISDIQVKSTTFKIQTALISANRQLDVAEPGTGISLQQLTQALRSMLNLPQTRIAGEVLCATPDCDFSQLRLRLRVFQDGQMHVLRSDAVGARSLDGYFHLSALRVLEVIDPYVLAAYLYYYEMRRDAAVEIAEDLLRRQHPQSAWAANLIGNRHLDEGRPGAALRHYEQALQLSEEFGPDDFAVPHKNIGLALIELGDFDGAIHRFSDAMALDAGNFEVWRGIGVALLAKGDPGAAAEHFGAAADLAPDELLSWTLWGDALSAAGRYREAFRRYHIAVDLNPLDTTPRMAWRRALTGYIGKGPEGCDRVGPAVAEYLRVAGKGVPASFRAELLEMRAACGLAVPHGVEES